MWCGLLALCFFVAIVLGLRPRLIWIAPLALKIAIFT